MEKHWFELTGDSRLGACATDGCGQQPTWRFEAGGTGSDYCSGCKDKIATLIRSRDAGSRAFDSLYGKLVNMGE